MPLNSTLNIADLPIPDAAALSHSERLKQFICEEIQRCGAISFAHYMQLALYAPGLGYYSAGSRKFGPTGDFVTAPEISPLFSQCIARQCQQVLAVLNNPDILEFGAGSGAMAAAILKDLSQNNALPQHYYILEISAELRQRQQEYLAVTIPEIYHHVIWLDQLPQQNFNGVILANEVLDAMPITRFHYTRTNLEEFAVACIDQELTWQLYPASNELKRIIESYELELPNAYDSEINLSLRGWIASIAEKLSAGMILICDYGFPRTEYYHWQRDQGTLMCHYRHHAHDNPFLYPGLQDITAHVDFTAVAEIADANKLQIAGYTNQASFLLNCGLLDLMSHTILPGFEQIQMNQAIKKLTSPADMGELFKVIALTRDIDFPLLGFSQFDQRSRL